MMENSFPEKGTIEILHNSKPELSDPQFTELLMKRIADERNKKIKIQFWLNYGLAAMAISLIIFFIGRSIILDLPVVNGGHDGLDVGGSFFSDYWYFFLPLIGLVILKKLVNSRSFSG